MSYLIYKMAPNGSDCKRLYLTDIPDEGNWIGGIGYQGMADGSIPPAAGTAPTEEDAKKLCEYLRIASYGPSIEHFYEKCEDEVKP